MFLRQSRESRKAVPNTCVCSQLSKETHGEPAFVHHGGLDVPSQTHCAPSSHLLCETRVLDPGQGLCCLILGPCALYNGPVVPPTLRPPRAAAQLEGTEHLAYASLNCPATSPPCGIALRVCTHQSGPVRE